ncbi:MAG: 1-deoxy-D-xylulose-5-phosphate synthase [Eubacteriales bacterium]|nr:1-deoxy-D-xylulose-5-phosphate synthase [Eubacteriales bacterium]
MRKKLTEYDFPNDLKNMDINELELLSYDIRDFLISNISCTGGHLASNLGAVELSIALHKVFESPGDKIVWDVGHQSYIHKILTGRADKFCTLRKTGGLSGFPRISESPHDIFSTGHGSNSISLVTGLAKARDLNGEKYNTVAVIGDGALSGGLAYEGLNNLGDSGAKAIVILNDNGMSISKSTGGVSKHLSKLRVSKGYYSLKRNVKKASKKIPGIGENIYSGMEKLRDSLKYVIVNGVIFEEMGFTYIGPLDGHNIEELSMHMELAKNAQGPVLLHIITEKGKGYRNAEVYPGRYHGTGPFDPETGAAVNSSDIPTYSDVFGKKLVELASDDDRIVAVSAAMTEGTGLSEFCSRFPDRTFDVGMAEEHAVSFAAGLAKGGARPFVAIYSTFLQRAYDQIITDVCLQGLPVIFAADRAGNVGADGETHHGMFDISYFSHMPGMTVMAPADGRELEQMMDHALTLATPCVIRYPRGENGDILKERIPLYRGSQIISQGKDAEIWALGSMVKTALEAAEILKKKGIDTGVANVRFVSPADEEKIISSAKKTKHIITLEDNIIKGGFGEKAAALLMKNNIKTKMINMGWPDKFIEHGSAFELYKKYRLDAAGTAERISDLIEGKA